MNNCVPQCAGIPQQVPPRMAPRLIYLTRTRKAQREGGRQDGKCIACGVAVVVVVAIMMVRKRVCMTGVSGCCRRHRRRERL